MDRDYTIAAVIKALKTLKQFNSERREMTLTELSNSCDISKSSMLRILASLEAEGFVKYDEETKKYKLGVTMFYLGNTAFDFSDTKKVLFPILKKTALESQLLIHLAALVDNEVIVIDRVWSSGNMDMAVLVSSIGGPVPIHCTGVGKVLTAYCSERQRQILLDRCDFKIYTENTIGSREEYMKVLEDVRKNGKAFNDGEHEPYLRCITRPIYDMGGNVVAAMSLSGMSHVITDDKLEYYDKISRKAAMEASKELGYHLL